MLPVCWRHLAVVNGCGVKVGNIPEPSRKAVPMGNKQVLKWEDSGLSWQIPADSQESFYFNIDSFNKSLSFC